MASTPSTPFIPPRSTLKWPPSDAEISRKMDDCFKHAKSRPKIGGKEEVPKEEMEVEHILQHIMGRGVTYAKRRLSENVVHALYHLRHDVHKTNLISEKKRLYAAIKSDPKYEHSPQLKREATAAYRAAMGLGLSRSYHQMESNKLHLLCHRLAYELLLSGIDESPASVSSVGQDGVPGSD